MDKMIIEGLPAAAIEYIAGLEKQIDRLTELLRLSQKARFGASSEKGRYVLDEQVSLFNEAEVYVAAAPEPVIIKTHTRKQKRTKEELAKALPVKEVVMDIPENERVCGICESELRPIGREFVRREISIIPAQAYITETYRINYACAVCEAETGEANIVKSPVPVPVIKRGLASPSAAAHVFYQKYVNAMPLYRQAKDWANFGVKLCRATLANWIIYIALNWLTPLWEQMRAELLTAEVILADETVVQVLKEPGKTPQSESRMWVYATGNGCGPPIILFEYQPDRKGERAKEFLKGAKLGFFLHTDGYSGYNSVKDAVHCGCFAHLRRKFNDALPKTADKSGKALEGLTFCQKLFALEEGLAGLSPEERLLKRLEHSKPVLNEFFEWAATVNPLSSSKLVEAITYARNQREALSVFLKDGRIDISTNKVENAIRPFTVGRKNFLFSDTVDGAKASAIAYSIIETAKANGLNPYKYLLYLFTKLPSVLTKNSSADLSEFFPWNGPVRTECLLSL